MNRTDIINTRAQNGVISSRIGATKTTTLKGDLLTQAINEEITSYVDLLIDGGCLDRIRRDAVIEQSMSHTEDIRSIFKRQFGDSGIYPTHSLQHFVQTLITIIIKPKSSRLPSIVPQTNVLGNRKLLRQVKEIFHGMYIVPEDTPPPAKHGDQISAVCPIHGEFVVRVNNVIYQKSGCIKCSQLRKSLTKKYDKDRSLEIMKEFYAFVSFNKSQKVIQLISVCEADNENVYHNLVRLFNVFVDTKSNGQSICL